MQKIVLGISGSSGVILGLRLLVELSLRAKVFLIVSKGAKNAFLSENGLDLDEILTKNRPFSNKNSKLYFIKGLNLENVAVLDDRNLAACVSSGSFGIDKTIIAPCSINTLAKIANGISDSLLTRACAVALKEQKKLILGVREMPFSQISLKQMSELSSLGVGIAPPVMGFYSQSSGIDDMIDFVVGKWLDLLGFENKIYKRWTD